MKVSKVKKELINNFGWGNFNDDFMLNELISDTVKATIRLTITDKKIMLEFEKMCTESLSPEMMDAFDKIKERLLLNRRGLK